jgi:hypothetical protein
VADVSELGRRRCVTLKEIVFVVGRSCGGDLEGSEDGFRGGCCNGKLGVVCARDGRRDDDGG